MTYDWNENDKKSKTQKLRNLKYESKNLRISIFWQVNFSYEIDVIDLAIEKQW